MRRGFAASPPREHTGARDRRRLLTVGTEVACFTTKQQPHLLGGTQAAQRGELLIDTGATVHVIKDPSLRRLMYDLSPPPPSPQYILMNEHPEPVLCRGSLDLPVVCSRSGTTHVMRLRDCVFVASSRWNILSWSKWADSLFVRASCEPWLRNGRTQVVLPVGGSDVVWGRRAGGLFLLRLGVCGSSRTRSVAETALVHEVGAGDSADGDPDNANGTAVGGGEHSVVEGDSVETLRTGAHTGGQRAKKGGERWGKVGKGSETAGEGGAVSVGLLREGARILASAVQQARRFHDKTSHSASMNAMQTLARQGALVFKEAAVRKAFLALTPADLACAHCASATQDKKKTHAGPRLSEKEGRKVGRWTVDVSTSWPWPVFGRSRCFSVFVAPNNKGVFAVKQNTIGEVLAVLAANKERWERVTGEPMLILGSDGGGENRGGLFTAYCEEHKIVQDFTAPGSSAGQSETYIGVLQDHLRAALNRADLPESYWAEALNACTRALDMMPCAPLEGLSMYEHRTGIKPPLHSLHPFGAYVTAHIPDSQRGKGHDRGREGIMLGPCENECDGWRVETLDKGTLITSRSVTVHPNVFPRSGDVVPDQASAPLSFAGEDSITPQPAGVSLGGFGAPKRVEAPGGGLGNGPDALEPAPAAEVEREPAFPQVLGMPPAPELPKRVRSQPARFSDADYRAAAQHDSAAVTSAGGGLPRLGHTMPAGQVPTDRREASTSEEKTHWLAADEVEIANFVRNKTLKKTKAYSAIARAARRNGVLKSKPVYDRKPLSVDSTEAGPTYIVDGNGTKVRFKSRIVVKGFAQKAGSFGEVYAGTPSDVTNKLMFSHALFKGWALRAKDVTSAFLLPSLPQKEWVVFTPPPGFESLFKKTYNVQDDEVLLLVRPLYGMRQAAAKWAELRDGVLTSPNLGFVPVRSDPSFFVHKDKAGVVDALTAPHVDDVAMSGPAEVIDPLMAKIAEQLPMTGDGELRWHLKVDIARGEEGRVLEYSQPLYARQILVEAQMVGCNAEPTPSLPKVVLLKPTEPVTAQEAAELKKLNFDYPRVVAMLGWLMMISRPDLAESVSVAKSFVADYRPHHVRYVKHMVRYLAGSLDYGIRYTLDTIAGQPDAGKLKMYVDSNFQQSAESEENEPEPDDVLRSRFGGAVLYNGGAVAWWSQKHGRTCRSSTDSEIIGLDEGARRALWFRQIAMDMGIEGGETIEIFEDNAQAEGFANDTKVPKRTKYVNRRYHATRDDVKFGDIKVSKIASKFNIADIFTKPLPPTLFRRFRELLGVVPCKLNARET